MSSVQIIFKNKKLKELFEKNKDIDGKYRPVKNYDFGKQVTRQFIKTIMQLEDLNP